MSWDRTLLYLQLVIKIRITINKSACVSYLELIEQLPDKYSAVNLNCFFLAF